MNSNVRRVSLVVVALMAVAGLLRPLASRLEEFSPGQDIRAGQLAALSGRGGVFALLGGLRSAAASMFWLRTNLAWEKRDLAETTALIKVTVAADERPLYFWLNGARMIAHDMPEWRASASMPTEVRRRINDEQARVALTFLTDGLQWHGAEAELYVEMANIHWRRLGDLEQAARYYRLAAEQPGAPFYAGRIYAELLSALGRKAEALAWLKEFRGKLPPDDSSARLDVVDERIAVLEKQARAR